MDESGKSEVLIAIAPSPARRWLGVSCLGGVGLLLLLLTAEVAGGWKVAFAAFALLLFWTANRMRAATADRIELTREVLRTGRGTVLTRIENVRAVERGAFALKPSNGFLVRLGAPEKRGWAPGLWWRHGRLLGIGGVISGAQTRAMAEILTALVQGQPDDAD